ncbi:hypothetical protein VP01_230g2 [Puccinia sorghi]|uniref:Uncharacterized protein n=1 Tax=Puccinia sorghi TaxID=27349 RepID=A0A0L6V7V6_9BASI|nr:hypothetical protein VP01_230g2 [Puccinia sorghi]
MLACFISAYLKSIQPGQKHHKLMPKTAQTLSRPGWSWSTVLTQRTWQHAIITWGQDHTCWACQLNSHSRAGHLHGTLEGVGRSPENRQHALTDRPHGLVREIATRKKWLEHADRRGPKEPRGLAPRRVYCQPKLSVAHLKVSRLTIGPDTEVYRSPSGKVKRLNKKQGCVLCYKYFQNLKHVMNQAECSRFSGYLHKQVQGSAYKVTKSFEFDLRKKQIRIACRVKVQLRVSEIFLDYFFFCEVLALDVDKTLLSLKNHSSLLKILRTKLIIQNETMGLLFAALEKGILKLETIFITSNYHHSSSYQYINGIFFYECHKMILIYQIYIVLLCQIHNLYDTWKLCDGGTILQKYHQFLTGPNESYFFICNSFILKGVDKCTWIFRVYTQFLRCNDKTWASQQAQFSLILTSEIVLNFGVFHFAKKLNITDFVKFCYSWCCVHGFFKNRIHCQNSINTFEDCNIVIGSNFIKKYYFCRNHPFVNYCWNIQRHQEVLFK